MTHTSYALVTQGSRVTHSTLPMRCWSLPCLPAAQTEGATCRCRAAPSRAPLITLDECHQSQPALPTPPRVQPETCSFAGNADWLSAQTADCDVPEHA
jgi:hypothetical protein